MLVNKLIFNTPTIQRLVRVHISPGNLVSVNSLAHRAQGEERTPAYLKEAQKIMGDYLVEQVELAQEVKGQPKRKEVL